MFRFIEKQKIKDAILEELINKQQEALFQREIKGHQKYITTLESRLKKANDKLDEVRKKHEIDLSNWVKETFKPAHQVLGDLLNDYTKKHPEKEFSKIPMIKFLLYVKDVKKCYNEITPLKEDIN